MYALSLFLFCMVFGLFGSRTLKYETMISKVAVHLGCGGKKVVTETYKSSLLTEVTNAMFIMAGNGFYIPPIYWLVVWLPFFIFPLIFWVANQ